MNRVIIETPFAGDVERNQRYAREALLDSLRRGEAPLASHLLYPQVLDDLDSVERALGIEAGLAWTKVADAVVVYKDLGISPGMQKGIERAVRDQVPIWYRTLPSWQSSANSHQPTASIERPS